ncbi:MAG: hypothetical protein ACREM8_14150 [Vulcanimicrobiaceae bacterium]
MSAQIDVEPAGLLPPALDPGRLAALPLQNVGIDVDGELGHRLPTDHPAWSQDAIAISRRARALFAKLKPVAVRVLTFWDHHVRSIAIGSGRRLSVDASGSYRLD